MKTNQRILICLAGTIGLTLLLVSNLAAATYSIVRSFNGGPGDASLPYNGLVNAGSKLYGYSGQTLFSINLDGTGNQSLHTFSGGSADGSSPMGSLASDGSSIYGATISGGTNLEGTVWAVNADGSNYRLLASLPGAATLDSPNGGVSLLGSTLLGTATVGGIGLPSNGGVFSVGANGTGLAPAYLFRNIDGAHADRPLVSNGSQLFGTAPQLVNDDRNGFLFGISGGVVSPIHSFRNVDGVAYPEVFGAVGTTILGGNEFGGEFFTIDANGSNFHLVNDIPSDKLTRAGSLLYGTMPGGAHGLGAVFSIRADGTDLHIVYSFTGGADGSNPFDGLTLVGSTLYGTTQQGGAHNNGIVFALAVPEPSTLALAGLALAALVACRYRTKSTANGA